MRNSQWLLCVLAFTVLVCAGPAVLAGPVQEEMEGQAPAEMPGEMEMSPEEAAMMKAFQESMTPGPQHQELAESAGTYDMTVKMWQDPSGEPETLTGTAERSMIMGGRVLEERVQAEFMGMPFTGEARTGYDNVTGTWWSTWIDNMSTGLARSTGKEKEDGTMVFLGEAPHPMAGGMVKQKTVVSHTEDGSEMNTMYEERDGEWVKTMEIVYTRK
jgi:hypothetical protein